MDMSQNEAPPLPYRAYGALLKERLGGPACKVGLDARFTCPNIDGTVARGGCTFCTNPSFSFQPMDAVSRHRDVRTQLDRGMDFYRERRGAARFIAYFQTFTNTYAPVAALRELYEQVLEVPDVVGLAISTRPDCVPDAVLDLLEELAARTYLTVELGLQSASDRTLQAMNRGHTQAQFHDAMARMTARGLKVKVHLLFGYPGEDRADALLSVAAVNASGAEGVKLHHLQVLRGTQLGREFERRPFPVFTVESYEDLLLEVIAHLDPRLYVDRLFATCRRDWVIAPDFGAKASVLRERFIAAMRARGVTQGCALGDRG